MLRKRKTEAAAHVCREMILGSEEIAPVTQADACGEKRLPAMCETERSNVIEREEVGAKRCCLGYLRDGCRIRLSESSSGDDVARTVRIAGIEGVVTSEFEANSSKQPASRSQGSIPNESLEVHRIAYGKSCDENKGTTI